ncbi:hypothetical protein [Lysinibacillus sp. NPDC047702]|uniref:hypothetical protein n=1 Tax=unclassified Lysinibacillus TaxID=2636778 RepID=UPI003CFC1D55
MKNDIKEQYKKNSLALRNARLSSKRRLLIIFSIFMGFAGMLSLMFSDFYEWGDGGVSAVTVAVWQLYTSDKKMVKITEKPLKYLTLTKYVNENEIIETINQENWNYLNPLLFEKNRQK